MPLGTLALACSVPAEKRRSLAWVLRGVLRTVCIQYENYLSFITAPCIPPTDATISIKQPTKARTTAGGARMARLMSEGHRTFYSYFMGSISGVEIASGKEIHANWFS